MKELKADICVIGAGAAGLSVAAGSAQLGADTILVESGTMGGDCLNVGCVPSKSLLAAAKRAVLHRRLADFGLRGEKPSLDPQKLRDHIKGVIAAIEPMDSVARFEGLGVTVLRERARFIDPETIAAGATRIKARRFVLAVGSRPFIPPIAGIDGIDYLTNETIFDKVGDIHDLIVLGGGPIGIEMAQANARLGAKVAIVEMARILPKDDADARELIRVALARDGVSIREGTTVKSVARTGAGIALTVERDKGPVQSIEAGHLLVAAGRRPDLADLDLGAAGIQSTPQGITVDSGLQTSNRRVFAVGDCTGHPAFTHVGSYHAGIVIRRALFRLPARVDYRALPWVTFTEPELAQVGLTEAGAKAKFGDGVSVVRLGFEDNDRARTDRETEGFIKVVANKRGAILGVTIVGENAGELLAPWCLAMAKGHKLSSMASLVLPYPTRGELSKRAAGQFYAPKLFGANTRRLVRFLRWLG